MRCRKEINDALSVRTKVKDVICGDALSFLGRLGKHTKYLYDIWPTLGGAARDRKFQAAKRKLLHVWGWGDGE
ncbi:MAG TPA: hypothetical protein VFA26_11295 [Gemmataceae bacterium]|nr:hypothetical protein [Gemmataceae bacterium]